MACFSAFIYGVFAFFLGQYFPFLTLSLSLLLLFSLRRGRWQVLAVLLLLSLGGFLYAGHSYSPPCQPSLLAGRTFEVEAEPVSLARVLEGSGQFSQTVRVVSPKGWPEQLRLVTPEPLPPDRICAVTLSVSRDAALMNPGGGEIITAFLLELRGVEERRGTVPFLDFFSAQRTRLNAFMRDRLSPETAPFLMSIVTGERGLITEETRDSFSRTGLAHILSISGAHFGLLLFVIFRLSLAAIRRLPYGVLVRLTTVLTPSQAAALICAPFMVFYLGISSINIPALRAFIMVSLFLLGLLVQREGFWLNTLLFAATVILLMSPESVLDLSFQLSFVSVLAIGMVSERWIRKEDTHQEGEEKRGAAGLTAAVLSYLRASLIISLAATIATAPLVAWQFHYLSLVSPLANLVFTPVIGFVILPLALLASFAWLLFGVFPLQGWLDSITGLVLSAINFVSRWRWADLKIPAFPLIALLSFYAGLILYLFLEHRGDEGPEGEKSPARFIPLLVSLVPLLVCACLSLLQPPGVRVTYLDAGQGDAAVAELPDGRTLVVDTGRRGFEVEGFLRYRGISRVEAIALSHGQADHAGGAMRLMRRFRVREVWDNGRLVYTGGLPEEVSHRPLQRGDSIRGEGYRITALHPYDGFYTRSPLEDEENNDSLVLRIEGKRRAFLFAGDVEDEAGENLSFLGGRLRSDVLKVPHHGSRSSASEAFISTVSPVMAVISVGRDNPYGHPHEEALELLSGASVVRTDRAGAVSVRELPDGSLEVKSWKDSGLEVSRSIKEEWLNIKKLFWVW